MLLFHQNTTSGERDTHRRAGGREGGLLLLLLYSKPTSYQPGPGHGIASGGHGRGHRLALQNRALASKRTVNR